MQLSRKAKAVCGIGIAAVIIAGVFVLSSSRSVPPRCHPKLIERPEESFELVEVKTKHYSDITYWGFGNFRGRILRAKAKLVAALRGKKLTYRPSGPLDVLFITFRAKNMDSSCFFNAEILDSNGTIIWRGPNRWRYDPKTRTGVVELPLPKTPTNLAGWNFSLQVREGAQLNVYGHVVRTNRTYAVFSL